MSLSLPAALISTRAAARHCHRPPVDSRLPRLRLQPPPPRPPPAARIPPKLSPALFVCVPVKKRFGGFELSLCLSRACLGKLIMCRFILSSTGALQRRLLHTCASMRASSSTTLQKIVFPTFSCVSPEPVLVMFRVWVENGGSKTKVDGSSPRLEGCDVARDLPGCGELLL